MTTSIIGAIRNEFLRYRALAEGAIEQLSDEQIASVTGAADNSVAVICQHVAGNLRSRFTDFLTTDGEKPWRQRDSEFEPRPLTRQQLLDLWADGWQVLLSTIDGLTDAHLSHVITIRRHPLTVFEALARSLAHTSYHAGQIVYVAKTLRGDQWQYLSIPPGQSETYNTAPDRDRGETLAARIQGEPR